MTNLLGSDGLDPAGFHQVDPRYSTFPFSFKSVIMYSVLHISSLVIYVRGARESFVVVRVSVCPIRLSDFRPKSTLPHSPPSYQIRESVGPRITFAISQFSFHIFQQSVSKFKKVPVPRNTENCIPKCNTKL